MLVFSLAVGIVRSRETTTLTLSDAKCRSVQSGTKLQKLTDGGGLQLWVQPSGARLWRLAYRFDGKQKLLALGVYPTITLAKARQARQDAKRLLADGLYRDSLIRTGRPNRACRWT